MLSNPENLDEVNACMEKLPSKDVFSGLLGRCTVIPYTSLAAAVGLVLGCNAYMFVRNVSRT